MARILYAEDDDAVREFVVDFLEYAGYSVVAVADGRALLDRLTTEPFSFDVVVTDNDMPNLCGVEVLRHIRDEERQHLPVIVFATVRPTVVEQITRLGGVYVAKPSTELLLPAIEAVLTK